MYRNIANFFIFYLFLTLSHIHGPYRMELFKRAQGYKNS